MPRALTSAFIFLAMLAVLSLAAPTAALAASSGATPAFVERFANDPLEGTIFRPEGDVVSRFTFLAREQPHFTGDRPGALRVLYDTTLPTGRLSAPFGGVLSTDASFEFGAILTIRSAGFHADPQGFSQIAFGLWNGHTTGLGRTSFPSDTFDLVEADYFANVTDFGGPFLSPSVFGGAVGTNAFDNFAFQSAEIGLPFDTPILVQGRYDAATEKLTLSASRVSSGVTFAPIRGARAVVDLSQLHPAFLVDVIGVAAYGEGWPSLRAEVDYDLIYVGALPPPFRVARTTDGHGRTSAPGSLLGGGLRRLGLDRFDVQHDVDVLAK